MDQILVALAKCNFITMEPFGSRVVGCATAHSDYDYLVLVPERPSLAQMEGSGFLPDCEDPLYGLDFSSWKNGKTNLVFTDSKVYFDATVEACAFCTKYEVFDKEDRCNLHEVYRSSAKFNLGERECL